MAFEASDKVSRVLGQDGTAKVCQGECGANVDVFIGALALARHDARCAAHRVFLTCSVTEFSVALSQHNSAAERLVCT